MIEPEFRAWPKIARLNRDCMITEKLDGSNACIIVADDYGVWAQSRTRLIFPEDDNYGFATWVQQHSEALATLLGPGYHYGEWWGAGINRGYGLRNTDKRFSLFNVTRWRDVDFSSVPGLGVVPVLYEGPFHTFAVTLAVEHLRDHGSIAVPGYRNPEGVVVFHIAGQYLFKVTLHKDAEWKGRSS